MWRENNSMFSTPERDNDNSSFHCAKELKAAWWYWKCMISATLNGPYINDGVVRSYEGGILWYSFFDDYPGYSGLKNSLMFAEMKLRPQYDYIMSATSPNNHDYMQLSSSQKNRNFFTFG